jgi:hypothetical protein
LILLIGLGIKILKNKIMPCSNCGSSGHNIRTCPSKENNPEINPENNPENNQDEIIDDGGCILETMIIMEGYLRELIILDKVRDIDSEQLQIYENMLNTKKTELKLINLEKRNLYIYIVEGNSNFIDFNSSYNVRFIGKLFPRSIMPITTFTGYRYIIVDSEKMSASSRYYIPDISRNPLQNKHLCNLDISNNMNDTINININDKNYLTFTELNNNNKTLFSLLKHNYLIEQLIRLGAKDNPNLEAILDLHQDIEMPDIEPIDLEAAGIPNQYTNMN